jgi:hypothetical protein
MPIVLFLDVVDFRQLDRSNEPTFPPSSPTPFEAGALPHNPRDE